MSKTCKLCKKKIMPDQRATLLHTFDGHKTIEKIYWHLSCYTQWFHENSIKNAEKMLSEAVVSVMPKNLINMLHNNK